MTLTKDYYTAAELDAWRHREVRARRTPVRLAATDDSRPVQRTHRPPRLQKLIDNSSGRLLVGAWASNFVHS
jgi:hypothetical protein